MESTVFPSALDDRHRGDMDFTIHDNSQISPISCQGGVCLCARYLIMGARINIQKCADNIKNYNIGGDQLLWITF